MHHPIRLFPAGLATAFAFIVWTSGVAVAKPINVEYSIRYIGFTIGSAQISGDVSSKKYQLNGRMDLSGIAKRIAGQGGSLKSSGVVTRTSLSPKNFSWRFDGYKGLSQVAVQYSGGNARKVTAKLAPGSNKDRVALLPKHRRGVIDPLTGFAALAKGKPETVCNGSRALFNGVSRFNVSLKYLGAEDGTIMCSFVYHPVAGHPREVDPRKAARRKNTVWFKKFDSVYLPVKAVMEATVGSVTIEATNM